MGVQVQSNHCLVAPSLKQAAEAMYIRRGSTLLDILQFLYSTSLNNQSHQTSSPSIMHMQTIFFLLFAASIAEAAAFDSSLRPTADTDASSDSLDNLQARACGAQIGWQAPGGCKLSWVGKCKSQCEETMFGRGCCKSRETLDSKITRIGCTLPLRACECSCLSNDG